MCTDIARWMAMVTHMGIAFNPVCLCEQNNSKTTVKIITKFYMGIDMFMISSWLNFGTFSIKIIRMKKAIEAIDKWLIEIHCACAAYFHAYKWQHLEINNH